MIFTSNQTANKWCDVFIEEDSLLCALDRIFDDAIVYVMKGVTYRRKKLEMHSIETMYTYKT